MEDQGGAGGVPLHHGEDTPSVKTVRGGMPVAEQRAPGVTAEDHDDESGPTETPESRMTGEGSPPPSDEEQKDDPEYAVPEVPD